MDKFIVFGLVYLFGFMVTAIVSAISYDARKDINDILEQICEIAHDGLMDASMIRQECEENPALNTAKNWREECENLEGKLCSILDLLKD